MDSQDHKITATSTGHEGHGVHLCHRCGWPFPNPHPSAKHRRAHKKVCGTIEGYKVILSEEHSEDHHLAVSDDEHASDSDEHTPIPNLVKKHSEELSNSAGVGGRSIKSEDDVFSDAVTDFSDSGISPRLEERFESVKSVEQKSVEGDLYGSESLNIDETNDRTEKINDPTVSEERSNSGAHQSESVRPVTDTTAEAVSVGLINGSQPDLIKSESPSDLVEGDGKEDIIREEVKVASEESKISDPALTAVEKKEESCDMVPEVVKDDCTPQNEAVENMDTSAEVKSVVESAEISSSIKNVGGIELAQETNENIDASVGLKKFSDTLREEGLSSRPDGIIQISIDKEVEQKPSLVGGENANEGEKCVTESKDFFPVEKVSAPSSAENTCEAEDDQSTRALKKDVDHCEENSNNKLLEAMNEKGEGAYVKQQVILDSTVPVDNSTDFPSSCEADTDAKNLKELSKTDSMANGSAGLDAELNHDTGDVLDKNSPPTATIEDPISPVISEPPNNVHVTSTDRVESEDVARKVTELKETTPEQPISKDSASLLTGSELLSKNSAKHNSCIGEVAEVSAELNHDGNIVVLSEKTKNPTPSIQEALPAKKCLNETPADVEESHLSEDVNMSKSVHNVPSGEPTCDGNVVASDKCSATLSSKEPVPSRDFQDLHETVVTCDDKNIINVEHGEIDDKLTKQKDGVSATDLSGSSISRSDSLEGNCGSVSALSFQSNAAVAETNSQSPDTLETNSQTHKTSTVDKSDDVDPPSFMTLVQSGGEAHRLPAATEIETVNNQQQPKSDALQAGWFPSLTNVVNESEGRKKNEEVIAKVTNWSPVKQQHSPLKNLLNEVKSPNMKQVPAADQKDENGNKHNGAPAPKNQDNNTNKDMEEWNSPARYPIEIKKEKKKKGRSYWVPFVCCSSVHRDL